jgi:AsmA family protein
LPLAAGIARIDRSVAAETQKLGVSVSGTLDLRNESIDLTFKPQLREGISIDLAQIAELVRLHGPLRHPQVSIDAVASVATAAPTR